MTKSFDRVADHYDATRGGEARGRRFAGLLAPHISGRPVLEVGVGTGLVALGLRELGVDVAGIDVAPAMLERARARVGPRVAVGDATCLPVRDASVGTAYSVWVLHLVDVRAVLREVRRSLRPGGRYLVTGGGEKRMDDAVSRIFAEMEDALRGGERPDRPDALTALAQEEGFSVTRVRGEEQRFPTRPSETISMIERRSYSMLWDVDDERWRTVVAPALERLRALPDEVIDRRTRPTLLVLEG